METAAHTERSYKHREVSEGQEQGGFAEAPKEIIRLLKEKGDLRGYILGLYHDHGREVFDSIITPEVKAACTESVLNTLHAIAKREHPKSAIEQLQDIDMYEVLGALEVDPIREAVSNMVKEWVDNGRALFVADVRFIAVIGKAADRALQEIKAAHETNVVEESNTRHRMAMADVFVSLEEAVLSGKGEGENVLGGAQEVLPSAVLERTKDLVNRFEEKKKNLSQLMERVKRDKGVVSNSELAAVVAANICTKDFDRDVTFEGEVHINYENGFLELIFELQDDYTQFRGKEDSVGMSTRHVFFEGFHGPNNPIIDYLVTFAGVEKVRSAGRESESVMDHERQHAMNKYISLHIAENFFRKDTEFHLKNGENVTWQEEVSLKDEVLAQLAGGASVVSMRDALTDVFYGYDDNELLMKTIHAIADQLERPELQDYLTDAGRRKLMYILIDTPLHKIPKMLETVAKQQG